MGLMKRILAYFKQTYSQFSSDEGFMMAAALAYYTLFSIGPLLVIVITIISFLTQSSALEGEFFTQLGVIMGKQSALQLKSIVENARLSSSGLVATMISIGTLLVSGTAVVVQLKETLNRAWNVAKNPNLGFKTVVIDRLLSLGFLAGIGFVFLVSLGLNAVAIVLSNQVQVLLPQIGETSFVVISLFIGATVTFSMFFLLFKYLPDAKLQSKDLLVGAFATTILFIIGKYLIAYYLGSSDIEGTFGSAGALASFMIWVYYNSVILIIGAEFTQVYAEKNGRGIAPTEQAVKVERILKMGEEVDSDTPNS